MRRKNENVVHIIIHNVLTELTKDTSKMDGFIEEYNRETIEKNKVSGNVYIIGESVISQSLKAALALRYGIESTVICPLETEPEYTEKDVLLLSSEEDIKEAIMDADTVIADPIYKTICSEKVNFVAMPHEAYSGRIYRKEVCDFIH